MDCGPEKAFAIGRERAKEVYRHIVENDMPLLLQRIASDMPHDITDCTAGFWQTVSFQLMNAAKK